MQKKPPTGSKLSTRSRLGHRRRSATKEASKAAKLPVDGRDAEHDQNETSGAGGGQMLAKKQYPEYNAKPDAQIADRAGPHRSQGSEKSEIDRESQSRRKHPK